MASNEFNNYYIPEAPQDFTNPEVLQQMSLGSVTNNLVSTTGSNTSSALRGTATSGASNIQTYQVSGLGVGTFGDGSDGDVEITGSTTLTSDKYYKNLTIAPGGTLNPGGYRIFVSDKMTVAGTIARNGNDGTVGSVGSNADAGSGAPFTAVGGVGGAGGAGGAALADGYLKGSVAGKTGSTGNMGQFREAGGCQVTDQGAGGVAGTATTNSIGYNGSAGGTGGDGGTGGFCNNAPYKTGTAGGAGGTATASNVKLIANWHLSTLLDIGSTGAPVKFDNSAGSGSGGGGGGGGADSYAAGGGGGGGGGSGSPGAIVAIYAKEISLASTGYIKAIGGDGGDGGNGGNGNGTSTTGGGGGGGAGGAGGDGGQLIIVYNTLKNSVENSVNLLVSGGSGGTGGNGGNGYNGGGDGSAGADGNAGSAGNIRLFQLSL